jgi:hypothetical protein
VVVMAVVVVMTMIDKGCPFIDLVIFRQRHSIEGIWEKRKKEERERKKGLGTGRHENIGCERGRHLKLAWTQRSD